MRARAVFDETVLNNKTFINRLKDRFEDRFFTQLHKPKIVTLVIHSSSLFIIRIDLTSVIVVFVTVDNSDIHVSSSVGSLLFPSSMIMTYY